jgi:hypothetical protein
MSCAEFVERNYEIDDLLKLRKQINISIAIFERTHYFLMFSCD